MLPGGCLKKEVASMIDVLCDAQRMFWSLVHPSRRSRVERQAEDIQNCIVWRAAVWRKDNTRRLSSEKRKVVMWTTRDSICSRLPPSLQVSRQRPDNKLLDQIALWSQPMRNYSQMWNGPQVSNSNLGVKKAQFQLKGETETKLLGGRVWQPQRNAVV